jgi:hypothetical protein
MRTRIPRERRLVRTPRDPEKRIRRAFGQRLEVQSRLPEARQVVRRGRGSFKPLPRLVGTRLGLRARLQERAPLVPGPPGANQRSPRLLRKPLELRSGLPAAGRNLYGGRAIEEPGAARKGRPYRDRAGQEGEKLSGSAADRYSVPTVVSPLDERGPDKGQAARTEQESPNKHW